MTETRQSTDPRPATQKNRDWAAILTVIGSLVLALLLVTVYFLVQPRTMTIKIDGPPGTRFLGNVTVDERATLVSGTTPAELTFRGRHLAFNVIPDSASTENFTVILAGQEQSTEYGAGGWYDARSVLPDIKLRALTETESTDLRNQYRRAPLTQRMPAPAQ